MAHNYKYPSITSILAGYDCTLAFPWKIIAKSLVDGSGLVECSFRVLSNGTETSNQIIDLEFKNGNLIGDLPKPVVIKDSFHELGDRARFVEIYVKSPKDEEIFKNKSVIPFYAIYSKEGKKSFFSDTAYKYGDPQIIAQIASYGKYVMTFPVIHIDRVKGVGDTLLLLNPYHKALTVHFRFSDGRKLKSVKVEPLDTKFQALDEILTEGEESWRGQVQLTANNRLGTYIIKHTLNNIKDISDIEHLDPFRDDPTHIPLAQKLRQIVGSFVKS